MMFDINMYIHVYICFLNERIVFYYNTVQRWLRLSVDFRLYTNMNKVLHYFGFEINRVLFFKNIIR